MIAGTFDPVCKHVHGSRPYARPFAKALDISTGVAKHARSLFPDVSVVLENDVVGLD